MHPHTLTHPSLSKSLPKAASRKTAPWAPSAPAGVCGTGKRAAARERGAPFGGADVFAPGIAELISGAPTA